MADLTSASLRNSCPFRFNFSNQYRQVFHKVHPPQERCEGFDRHQQLCGPNEIRRATDGGHGFFRLHSQELVKPGEPNQGLTQCAGLAQSVADELTVCWIKSG